jgi:hypothetical protein
MLITKSFRGLVMKKKPFIKSFKVFREVVRKGEIEYGFGKTEKFYELYYGFNPVTIQGVTSYKEAYEVYKMNFAYYDQHISKDSYLSATGANHEVQH